MLNINTKKVMKNGWRIAKDRNFTCLRIRVPGGYFPVELLPLIQGIAERFGNGTVHLTTRQGFEIPGISFEHIDEINTMLSPIIEELEVKICANLYNYIDQHIDRTLPKEHVGYIIDRTGYNLFKEEVLRDMVLSPKTKVANFLDFAGYTYDKNVIYN